MGRVLRALPRSFYDRPVCEVARDLVGRHLVCGEVVVRLVEVEAYAGEGADPGSHAYRGVRSRNAVMFGPPGRAYVYFTYGMHWCLNAVCEAEGRGAAVLLRAASVVAGADAVRARRPGVPERDLLRGPARLTKALAVDGDRNGTDLVRGVMRILPGEPVDDTAIRTGPRVGVTDLAPWRFWINGHPAVSTYRPARRV